MTKTSTIDRRIGAQLRALRLEKGIDKATLAQTIGQTESQLVAYEAGDVRIDAKSMLALCRTLQVNVAYFFRPWTNDMATSPISSKQTAAE